MKTASSNKKVREIINLVKDGKLVPRPDFQRRLVWAQKDKEFFLDTVLRGFPFPEIYLADGEVNLETGEGTQLLVDGLQRVNTLLEYFDDSASLRLLKLPPYRSLTEDEKRHFLQYDLSVRDLGSVGKEELVEVFKRINATQYSLRDIEINNAIYSGALKKFAEKFSECDFFASHNVFDSRDYKRMGDLRYSLSIICTLIVGYFNRDDKFADLLERFNDDFPLEQEIGHRIDNVIDFLNECNFEDGSRVWRKPDLFTLFIELDSKFRQSEIKLQPHDVVDRIEKFFSQEDAAGIASIYLKASIQAVNDKGNRIRRALIISGLLDNKSYNDIEGELVESGVFST